jgi:hypothetical protein
MDSSIPFGECQITNKKEYNNLIIFLTVFLPSFIAVCMEPKDIMLSEINQAQKDKYLCSKL